MIKIITIFDKHPVFIEMQYNSILKHVKGEYEYIVFNNGGTEDRAKAIQDECDRLSITCIRIVVNYNSQPSNISGDALNLAFGQLDGKIFKMDSDMFLFNDLDIEDLLKDDLVYIPTHGSNYQFIWSGIFGINKDVLHTELNFIPRYQDVGDTFGQSHIFTANPKYSRNIMELHCILWKNGDTLDCMINNDVGIIFNGDKFISNSKPDIYTPEKYDMSYERFSRYTNILKQYDFPNDYLVDFISVNGLERFIHFKSANWADYSPEYFDNKLEAIKNLIKYDKLV